MYKILIVDNIPSLNKGEMTILEGMLESFKILGDVEVSMLSARPEIDSLRYESKVRVADIGKSWPCKGALNSGFTGKMFVSTFVMAQHAFLALLYKISSRKVPALFKSEIWQNYFDTDLFIVGHDGTFGIGGSLGIPLLYPLYIPLVAKLMHRPMILYGGSIGKPKKFRCMLNRLYRFALSRIDFITLRERVSYQNVKDIGYDADNVYLTGDPAFLLKPASGERIREMVNRETIDMASGPIIGITVTRERACMAYPSLANPVDRYNKHNDVMAKVLDKLIDIYRANIIFLPHCIGFGNELDDRIVAKDIIQKCNNKEKILNITNEYSAAELKGLIGQFDFFIGERLHSVINAMSMGIPSVVISNKSDQRLDIIRMLGQENAVYHVENLDHETLLNQIDYQMANQAQIKEDLKIQVKNMQERAMLNGILLKELLDSIEKNI